MEPFGSQTTQKSFRSIWSMRSQRRRDARERERGRGPHDHSPVAPPGIRLVSAPPLGLSDGLRPDPPPGLHLAGLSPHSLSDVRRPDPPPGLHGPALADRADWDATRYK